MPKNRKNPGKGYPVKKSRCRVSIPIWVLLAIVWYGVSPVNPVPEADSTPLPAARTP